MYVAHRTTHSCMSMSATSAKQTDVCGGCHSQGSRMCPSATAGEDCQRYDSRSPLMDRDGREDDMRRIREWSLNKNPRVNTIATREPTRLTIVVSRTTGRLLRPFASCSTHAHSPVRGYGVPVPREAQNRLHGWVKGRRRISECMNCTHRDKIYLDGRPCIGFESVAAGFEAQIGRGSAHDVRRLESSSPGKIQTPERS